jgi:hypothetical protein
MGGHAKDIMPAAHAEAATISDSSDDNFSREAEAIYVGNQGGDVAVVLPGGSAVTFTSVPAGTILPVRCIRINSTNTTADDVVALMTRARE